MLSALAAQHPSLQFFGFPVGTLVSGLCRLDAEDTRLCCIEVHTHTRRRHLPAPRGGTPQQTLEITNEGRLPLVLPLPVVLPQSRNCRFRKADICNLNS